MNAESFNYFRLLFKRWWLIVLAGIIAGSTSYYFRIQQPSTYRSQVLIFLGNIEEPNPNLQFFDVGGRLALTYAQLVRSFDILEPTIAQLGLDLSPSQLQSRIGTSVIKDTPILNLSVTYSDPEGAAEIANTLAENLINNSPSALSVDEEQQLLRVSDQISDLESLISTTSNEAVQVLEDLSRAREETDQEDVDVLTERYNRLVDQLVSSRATLAQISDTYIQLANRQNRLDVIEQARPNYNPTGINPIFAGVFGALSGVILSVAAVLFFEYIDPTIRTEYEVQSALDIDLLGTIKKNDIPRSLLISSKTHSNIAEKFRSIVINIVPENSNQSIIVTSTNARAGRTFIAANLSLTMANNGLKVLLVDTDLRKPTLHNIFNFTNDKGLTTLLSLYEEQPELLAREDALVDDLIQMDIVKVYGANSRLHFIASGSADTHWSLESESLNTISLYLDVLKNAHSYDVIIFDCAPSLNFADSYILATKTKSEIIFAVEAKVTDRFDAMKVVEQFKKLNCTILGAILNKA